ncbi:MAG TPA: response regulator [Myxococcales bacterium]|nr:response regulator [Myxococcales bacterium]
MKVLVVEDNELNRKLLRDLLGHRGHSTEETATAAEAISHLSRSPAPDVVLLDIDIPGGGLTVVSHIKSKPALAEITVIAHTALAMRGDRERFLAAGCHGYISKPISVKTFVAEIEAIRRDRL